MSESLDDGKSSKKNPGRKKGCKLEAVNLCLGGKGGRAKHDEVPWMIDKVVFGDSDGSDSSYSSNKDSEYDDDDDDLDDMEIEAKCISDLEGNCLLPIGKIINAISNNMYCSRCAVSNHNAMMKDFIDFCTAYEEKIEKADNEILFYSKTER